MSKSHPINPSVSRLARPRRLKKLDRISSSFLIILAITTVSTAGLGQKQPAPAPCASAPERRQFDFWLGEWDVNTTATDRTPSAGSSVIQSVSGGCALLENWTSAQGGQGKSLNAYNPLIHQWQQYWIGQNGVVTEFRTSNFDGRSLSFFTDNGPGPNPKGRLTFSPIDSMTVRQHAESSADGGKTWSTVYDLYYHRKHS
jgi:hypothetical protein